MLDVPDISDAERKVKAWGSYLVALVPFLGMTVCGAALVVYASLGAKPDVLHEVLGLPSSFRALDSRALWLSMTLAGLIGSSLLVGKALLTKEQLRKRQAELLAGAMILRNWMVVVAEDAALDPDAVFITDLTFKIDEHALAIDMMVDNRNQTGIRIMGVCVNWIDARSGGQLLPHSLCVLSSERPHFTGPTQVAGTFDLTRTFNDFRDPTRAHVSFAFTRHGTQWKRWARSVGATLRV
jgi:hypothetical protein